MKGKHLLILLVLVAALGWAGYTLQKGSQNSWSESGPNGAGGKVFNLPLNDVAHIVVKTADSELNLVKKSDAWTVQERADYPAAYGQVSDFLRKLWELKTVQDVKVGPSQFARLELIEPGKGAGAGTWVEFRDKDGKQLAVLILGKRFMKKGDGGPGGMGDMPAGRYVLPLGASPKVSLVSDSLDEVNVKPESWLQRDFFKIENARAITLAGTTDAQHWKVTRESANAEWKLEGARPDEALDAAKVSPIATSLANPAFADVLAPDAKPADTGLDQSAVLIFETFDGFTYTLKTGKAAGENYPLTIEVAANLAKERTPGKDEKPEDKTKLDEDFKTNLKRLEDKLAAEKKFEGRPYLLAKFTVEQLLKDRAALLVEKKPETPPTSAVPPALKREPISVTTPPVSAPALPAAPPPPEPVAPKKEPSPEAPPPKAEEPKL